MDWEKAHRRDIGRSVRPSPPAPVLLRPTARQAAFIRKHLPGVPMPKTRAAASRMIDETVDRWKAQGWQPT
jgi:hypothetical protein